MKKPSAEDDGEEWDGFSDGESNEKTTAVPAADAQPAKDEKKTKNKKEKKAKEVKTKEVRAKEAQPKRDSNLKAGLSFAALEEAGEDDGVDVSAWDQLGLSPDILTSLSKLKFSTPTTVQKSCIPAILDGHDVVGKASTGSGKTLAFGIPILEHHLEKRGKKEDESDKAKSAPMALILSPTRELAHQLAKHIGNLIINAPDADARIALLTGGLSIQKQQRQLASADIVIGTPGRVWEILSTGSGLIRKMQGIKFLVVDEADRLLSEGHFKEVEEILGALDRKEHGDFPDMDEEEEAVEEEPNARQTLVFSATFHRDLQQKLAGKSRWTGGDLMDKKESMEYLLKKLNFREEKPKFIDVNPVQQMAEGLKEGIVECPAMEKVSSVLFVPADEVWPKTNYKTGSLSVLPSTLLPQAPNSCVYQLYLRCPPSYPIAAKFATPRPRPSLVHGSESPPSLRGAILFTLIRPQFYSRCHRRGGTWSRHQGHRLCYSLPRTSHGRYLRPPIWTYRSCRRRRQECHYLCPRGSCQCGPSRRQGPRPKWQKGSSQEATSGIPRY